MMSGVISGEQPDQGDRHPAIRVVVPTYNRSSFLREAVGSVLRQAYQDFELIVVDDGSTDETQEVMSGVRDPRLRYLRQDNLGGPAARNRGWRESTGSYLLFLDDDDILLPHALEELVRRAADCPDAGVIGGGYEYMDAEGEVLARAELWRSSERLDLARWVLSCPFIPSATLVRRDWLERVGGFDVEQEAAQDWDLWLRLAVAGCPMVWARRPVCRYRVHGNSITSDPERQKIGATRALDRLFAANVVPQTVRELWHEAYASVYINSAARAYGAKRFEQARRDAIRAAEYVPDWVGSGQLTERLIRRRESPIVTRNPEEYTADLLTNLPEILADPGIARRALARVAAASLFKRRDRVDRRRVVRLWWSAVRNDPAWLRNAGLWSMLGEAVVGERIVRPVRRGVSWALLGGCGSTESQEKKEPVTP